MKKFASFFAVFLFITLFAVASEAGDRNIPVEVAQLTDSLKKQFAPDRRVALLDVDYSFSDKNVMLRGVTTSAEAKNVLLKELARKGYAVMDCLELLPDVKGLEGKTCVLQLPNAFRRRLSSALRAAPLATTTEKRSFRHIFHANTTN